MATYAAFKHVELYNIGSGKRRVLKPPGGGSSDIFSGDMATTPRSIKNHMKSNIFTSPAPVNQTGEGRRPYIDSHNRLFGDSDRPFTPAKNHMKSNIPIGGDEKDSSLKQSNGNGHHLQEIDINGKNGGGDCDENHGHTTDITVSCNRYFNNDTSSFKSAHYLNPTYNSKINLCINDDYISIVNNESRNPLEVELKKESESKTVDENMNFETPLINAIDSNNFTSVSKNLLTGNQIKLETSKSSVSGDNISSTNKNRVPPGGFSSRLW